MWCGYHFIHSDVALLEAGGSWAWTIENGQYCIQSDGIDTNWYANGSPHKGCFQYYHWRYWYEGQDYGQIIGFVGDDVEGEVAIRGIFCVSHTLISDAGPHIGSQY